MRMIPCKKDCEAEEGEARTPVLALEDAAGVWICAANSLSSSPLLPVPLPTEPRSLPLFGSPRIRASDSLPKGKNTEGKMFHSTFPANTVQNGRIQSYADSRAHGRGKEGLCSL